MVIDEDELLELTLDEELEELELLDELEELEEEEVEIEVEEIVDELLELELLLDELDELDDELDEELVVVKVNPVSVFLKANSDIRIFRLHGHATLRSRKHWPDK